MWVIADKKFGELKNPFGSSKAMGKGWDFAMGQIDGLVIKFDSDKFAEFLWKKHASKNGMVGGIVCLKPSEIVEDFKLFMGVKP